MEWRNLVPYGKFHLQGTNLRVVDVPEAQIDASPDLLFDIKGHKIEVTGKVVVPYAKIAPKDITNAVRASDDEVIVGHEEEDPASRFEVMSDITLSLGDRVTIDTLGLTGRLTGSIAIRSGYDAITRGTGELSVDRGQLHRLRAQARHPARPPDLHRRPDRQSRASICARPRCSPM